MSRSDHIMMEASGSESLSVWRYCAVVQDPPWTQWVWRMVLLVLCGALLTLPQHLQRGRRKQTLLISHRIMREYYSSWELSVEPVGMFLTNSLGEPQVLIKPGFKYQKKYDCLQLEINRWVPAHIQRDRNPDRDMWRTTWTETSFPGIYLGSEPGSISLSLPVSACPSNSSMISVDVCLNAGLFFPHKVTHGNETLNQHKRINMCSFYTF